MIFNTAEQKTHPRRAGGFIFDYVGCPHSLIKAAHQMDGRGRKTGKKGSTHTRTHISVHSPGNPTSGPDSLHCVAKVTEPREVKLLV